MQLDEEGTHARVMRQRRELIEPNLAEHHGKLIDYTGDGFLAMFDSPVEAVRCAIVIQQSMVGRNASLPRDQWILYRIGIHLGDVVVAGPSEVYGDGLNIAVRLEGIASPGDVYVSGGVYEQIKNKLVCAYQSMGDRQVKNITDPVSVYRVLPDPAALSQARKKRWPVALLAVLVAINVAILGGLYFLLHRGRLPIKRRLWRRGLHRPRSRRTHRRPLQRPSQWRNRTQARQWRLRRKRRQRQPKKARPQRRRQPRSRRDRYLRWFRSRAASSPWGATMILPRSQSTV
jgi:hypothetical protein